MSEAVKFKAVCATPRFVYRIERNGVHVAWALARSNGSWGLHDLAEKPLTKVGFVSPKAVAEAAHRRGINP